jgi:hypothetical protein
LARAVVIPRQRLSQRALDDAPRTTATESSDRLVWTATKESPAGIVIQSMREGTRNAFNKCGPSAVRVQGTGSERPDIVVVDTSPMRLQDGAEVQRAILGVAAAFNCEPLPEDTELKPDAAAVSAGWRRAGGPSEGEQGDDMGDTETDVQTRMRMESGDETVLEPSEEEMAAADARVAEQVRAEGRCSVCGRQPPAAQPPCVHRQCACGDVEERTGVCRGGLCGS